jgi:hypothetical protein
MIVFGIMLLASGLLLLGSETARERYFFTTVRWWDRHADDWTPAYSHAIRQHGGGLLALGLLVLGLSWLLR